MRNFNLTIFPRTTFNFKKIFINSPIFPASDGHGRRYPPPHGQPPGHLFQTLQDQKFRSERSLLPLYCQPSRSGKTALHLPLSRPNRRYKALISQTESGRLLYEANQHDINNLALLKLSFKPLLQSYRLPNVSPHEYSESRNPPHQP